jgi:N-acetylmuramic acid 6-phosphate etherase
MTITGVDYDRGLSASSQAAGGHVKTALVMILAEVDADEARLRLNRADGFVRQAIAG